MPTGALQTVNLYFAGSARLYPQRKILLNAAPDAFVNNAQLLTNVAPTYAPEGNICSVSRCWAIRSTLMMMSCFCGRWLTCV